MLKNGEIMDERLPRWWDKWVNPTTMLALVGGIIWGVQLNMAVMANAQENARMAADQGRQDAQITQISNKINEMSIVNAKTVIMLDNMLSSISKIDSTLINHAKESEQWKRRIIENSSRNRP